MSLRLELLSLAKQPGADRSALARRFGVSRKTLYKWLGRFGDGAGGDGHDPVATLADRSRRPRSSPARINAAVESATLAVRARHPAWGPRKIHAVLRRSMSPDELPSVSTIARVLRRNGCVSEDASTAAQRWQRFEHERPNDLWQMDFKGDFALAAGGRCHALTILDDHSRYNLLLSACANQQRTTVMPLLMSVFGRYGLPRRILCDNGTPWGISHTAECYTKLEVTLMSLDVRVVHGRAYHPQTQGKEERFHRTLKVELLQHRQMTDLADAQRAFDPWRQVYNHERPHEALAMSTPASRYRMSDRSLPERIDEPTYHEDEDEVRSVNPVGQLQFKGRTYKLSEAFADRRVAMRPTTTDGVWHVHFSRFQIACLDERDGSVRMVRN